MIIRNKPHLVVTPKSNSGAYAGVIAGALLTAAMIFSQPTSASDAPPPNFIGVVPKNCEELAEAITQAVKDHTDAETKGVGSYDPSKVFQLNNDCLKLIQAIKIDMSVAIFDMSGWATILTQAADAFIQKIRDIACDLASDTLNDVLGRYNNIINLANSIDPNKFWSAALNYAVTTATQEGTKIINEQAAEWRSQIKDVTGQLPTVPTMPPLPGGIKNPNTAPVPTPSTAAGSARAIQSAPVQPQPAKAFANPFDSQQPASPQTQPVEQANPNDQGSTLPASKW